MPHVIVKMYPGRTIEQKNELAKAITDCVTSIAKCEAKSVSVAIEEVASEDWAEKVYRPDILEKKETLVKKPGYNPFIDS
jgi:4-oxalocrotonate tautomerase